jgi:hypothetical protein
LAYSRFAILLFVSSFRVRAMLQAPSSASTYANHKVVAAPVSGPAMSAAAAAICHSCSK